jgi:hypothetical protein
MQGIPSWYREQTKNREHQIARTRSECSKKIDECRNELRTTSTDMRGVMVNRWTRYADELEKTSGGAVFTKQQQADMRDTVGAIRRLLNNS